MRNNESLNKYLAGYLDGNGTITCNLYRTTAGWKPKMHASICGCPDIWPKLEAMFLEVRDHWGVGAIQRRALPSGKTLIQWELSNKDAAKVIGPLCKHLVVKGQHTDRMFDLFRQYGKRGDTIQDPEKFRDYVKWSRANTGPLKPKNHASKAWLAGYIDSDGYLWRRTFQEGIYTRTRMGCDFGCHPQDRAALELIAQSYGREIKDGRANEIRLKHHFSTKNPSFARSFLVPLLPHLRVKRWDAEQILAYYNTRRD